MKSQERIVIMIDPFTREAELYNMTSCNEIEIDEDSLIDLQPNENNEITISVNAKFTLKGLICKFKKPED